jgi:methylthioribose-1-phosphate isomerase
VPVTVICDSMAAVVLGQKKIDAVIVGADRIAANGDTANKIGTYQIAVLAREHNVPFYIAAPVSTFDLTIASGEQIPIEERSSAEVTEIKGIRIAPDVHAAHPAFDVTPNKYIAAIFTEHGVAKAPYAESLRALAGMAARNATSSR